MCTDCLKVSLNLSCLPQQLEEQERKEKEAEELKKQKELVEQERKRREAQRRQDALKKVREYSFVSCGGFLWRAEA